MPLIRSLALAALGVLGPAFAAQAGCSVEVSPVAFGNIDLMRAMQSPSAGATGGRPTPFDELTGLLQIAGARYSYRHLRLVSGSVNATGSLNVGTAGQLSGRMDAQLISKRGVVGRSGAAVGTYTPTVPFGRGTYARATRLSSAAVSVSSRSRWW